MSARRTTIYNLNVLQLLHPYQGQDSLKDATPVFGFESTTPFGTFNIGETLTDGPGRNYLGRIQHIHHEIGEYGESEILHLTELYFYYEE